MSDPTTPSLDDRVSELTKTVSDLLAAINFQKSYLDLSVTSAANSATGMIATSTDSLVIIAGSQSLTVQKGKQFAPGQYVILIATASPDDWMYGQITSYDFNSGALVVGVTDTMGAGTFTNWTISVTSIRGLQGPKGDNVLAALAEDTVNTGGTTYSWHAGTIRYDNVTTPVAAGSMTLPLTSVCYVEVSRTGVVSYNTTGFSNDHHPMAKVTLDGTQITNVFDARGDFDIDTVRTVAGREGDVVLTISDIGGGAPLDSPALVNTPTAPTAAIDTNTNQLATTKFVLNQASAVLPLMNSVATIGTSTRYSREDHIHATDTTRAPLASPGLTGIPTAPTAAVNTNTTQLATTAFVLAQSATAAPLMSQNTAAVGTATRFAREDHIHPTDTTRAPLASPGLTGTPTAPTAAVNTNTTQIATTAFVLAQAATVAPLMAGTAAVGTATKYAREDHVHPTDTTRAPLASPGLTGIPTAPTAAVNTNTTQLATTAFVLAQSSSALPLINATTAVVGTATKFSREDHVHPTDTTRAPLASPAFTGIPSASTAALGTNTTQLATTAFVIGQAATVAPLVNSVAAIGTSTQYARQDHVHDTDPTRAPVNSPTFTGIPAAPTAADGTNTTQLATTQFVSKAIANLINTAPSTLDTLNEIATALGNDPNFATTMTNSLATKAPLASPALTGTPTAPTAATADSSTTLATTAFVKAQAYATLASPALTGVPTAPTAAFGTNTTQLSTTAFVQAALAAYGVGSSAVIPGASNASIDGAAIPTGMYQITATNTGTKPGGLTTGFLMVFGGSTVNHQMFYDDATARMFSRAYASSAWTAWREAGYLDSPGFSGVPTAPTATFGTNTTQLATTAFVQAAAAPLAPLASPTLTGIPVAPTAAVNTNTTQLATTAFVLAQAATATPLVNGTAAVGTATKFAREDHVHGTDTTRAPLASPALTGVPTAPTASPNTNSTQIATTAYVDALGALKATIASPSFTGTPLTPTAAANDNSTQIANTSWVNAAIAASGSTSIVSIPVTSTAMTLTAAQYSNSMIIFTGVLTGNTVITVPNTAHAFIAANNTTGSYTLTVKSNGQTPNVQVVQNKANSLFCDTTGVYATSSTTGVQFAKQYTISTNTTLDLSYLGSIIMVPTAGVAITLPLATSYPAGAGVAIANRSSGTITVPLSGSDAFDSVASPMTLYPGDVYFLEADNVNAWHTVWYSNEKSPKFKTSVAAPIALLGGATDNGTDALQVTGSVTISQYLKASGAVTGTSAQGALIASNGSGTGQTSIFIKREGAPTDQKNFELLQNSAGGFVIRSINDAYSSSANAMLVTRGSSYNLGMMQLMPGAGNVLIGGTTDNGTDRLQVFGSIKSTTGGFVFPDGTIQTTANGTTAPISTVVTPTNGTTGIPTSGYSVGFVQVFKNNGRLIPGVDFTATDGVNVVLTVAATGRDRYEILTSVIYSPSTVFQPTSYTTTLAVNGTVITPASAYAVGCVWVFLNNQKLLPSDFTATNGTTITLTNGAVSATDVYEVISFTPFAVNGMLPLAGGTLTGNVTMDAAAGTARSNIYTTAGKNRWVEGVDGTAESGSNAGSNWSLNRYNDAGTYVDSPIIATRSTGIITLSQGIQLPDGYVSVITPAGKSAVINGDMRVAQRASATIASGAGGYGGPDRYLVALGGTPGGSCTQSAGTMVYNGITYQSVVQTVATAMTSSSGSNYWAGFTQGIEGFNGTWLIGAPATISFLFKATATGTYTVALRDANGSTSQSFLGTFNYTVANAVQKVVINVSSLPTNLNTASNSNLGLWLNIGAVNTGGTYQNATTGSWLSGNYFYASGSVNWCTVVSNYIAIANLKLEAGTQSTPMEFIDYGDSLRRCQRYYETGTFVTTLVNNGVYATWALHVPKRATPTGTLTGNASATLSGLTVDGLYYTYSGGSNANATLIYTASAEY